MRLSLLSLVVSVPSVVATPTISMGSVEWTAIDCPANPLSSGCTWQNTGQTDAAVALFFQVEMGDKATEAGFTCTDGSSALVLCSRKWTSVEDGSAGDCFFIVGAGMCQVLDTVLQIHYLRPLDFIC